jgi:hypothetical protein
VHIFVLDDDFVGCRSSPHAMLSVCPIERNKQKHTNTNKMIELIELCFEKNTK